MNYIEPILYTDPQNIPPKSACPICGGALYTPSLVCIRCRRDMP